MNIYIHTYICTYVHTYIHTYVYTYTHTHARAYVRTYVYTYMYVHTYVHVHTHIHTYIHTYIRTYIHTRYIYTYIHVHTHTAHKYQLLILHKVAMSIPVVCCLLEMCRALSNPFFFDMTQGNFWRSCNQKICPYVEQNSLFPCLWVTKILQCICYWCTQDLHNHNIYRWKHASKQKHVHV